MDGDDGENIDLRMVCRTCLATPSATEFQKLDAYIANTDVNGALLDRWKAKKKLTLWDCLHYCTHLEDAEELPIYICNDCCAELKVTYNFIKNALRANKILRLNLCATVKEEVEEAASNNNQSQSDLMVKREAPDSYHVTRADSSCSNAASSTGRYQCKFRCKICNEKVETRKDLKEHIKLHLDIISYNCRMCPFTTKKRSKLCQHYNTEHNVEPTTDMLRANTDNKPSKRSSSDPTTSSFAKQYSEYIAKSEYDGIDTKLLDFDESTIVMSPDEVLAQQQLAEIEQQLALSISNAQQNLQQAEYLELQNQEQQQHYTQNDLQQQIQLDATIITTSDGQQIATITQEQLQELQNACRANNIGGVGASGELNVGNEFIMMSDGTVEEVMGNGVVIEYINAADSSQQSNSITLDNGSIVPYNLVEIQQGGATTTTDNGNVMNMDVDQYYSDQAPIETGTESNLAEAAMDVESSVAAVAIPMRRKIKCKICSALFNTQDRLKTHMLTHNEIPHFFCDQCAFYTFFKVDLTQHYRTKHKLQPTQKQLQPKNKMKTPVDPNTKHLYTCDLCLFETHIRSYLRRHYQFKHQVQATEVQLRPAMAENDNELIYGVQSKQKNDVPDYPSGFNCKKCTKVFYWRNQFKEHYKEHLIAEKRAARAKNASYTTVHGNANDNGPNGTKTMISSPSTAAAMDETAAAVASLNALTTNSPAVIAEPIYSNINTPMINTTTYTTTQSQPKAIFYPPVAAAEVVTSSGGDIPPALPLDAIPQIVETDSTTVMINNNMDFDFNGDANLFEDFEDDNQDDEGEQEDDGVQNLVLTSDDDFEDLLTASNEQIDVVGNNFSQPFCLQCSKKFFSQYQFENHMFVHRGLAPYRCEMCTNLYNTKRALIRHYKAVHKTIPTRDMIQAKGDKVAAANVPVEHLNLDERKAPIMMCSNCPFESTEMQNIIIHLRTTHGITDENHILHKLPFECPRCIRCFQTKSHLIRHLERSHSVATIIQRQTTPVTCSTNSPAKNTTSAMLATGNNININNNNIHLSTTIPHTTIHTSTAITAATLNNLPPLSATTTTVGAAATTNHHSIISDSGIKQENAEATTTTTREAAAAAATATATALNDEAAFNPPTTSKTTHSGEVLNKVDENEQSDNVANRENPEHSQQPYTTTPNETVTHFDYLQQSDDPNQDPSSHLNNHDEDQEFLNNDASVDFMDIGNEITAINTDFDPAEVTITMSATAIGTIIPGEDGLDILNLKGESSTSAGQSPKSSPLKGGGSQYKPNAVYLCNQCQYPCESVEELSAHHDRHGQQQATVSPRLASSFECEICHCKYKSLALLKHHMKRHIARKYCCPQCPKTYINRTELQGHMSVHTGILPHKCDMCDKQFSYPHHLKRHRDVAHFGKRCMCPVEGCGRTFTTAAQLKMHTWNHTGFIPYKCKFCDRDFKKRELLRNHTKKVHNVVLTEEDIAEIFRSTMGYTNPHDFTVPDASGKMLRRSEVEASTASGSTVEVVNHADEESMKSELDGELDLN